MEEKVFLSEGGVTVTNARFVVSSQTYAMGGITSVKSYEEKTRPIAAPGLLALLIGLLLLFGGSTSIVVAGITLIVLGAFLLMIERSTFYVVLSSASGESKALMSDNREFISRVIGALTDVMVHRG